MYVAASTVTVKLGNMNALQRIASEQAALIQAQPGCRGLTFFRVGARSSSCFSNGTRRILEDARAQTMGKDMAALGFLVSREVVEGEVIAS